MVSDRMHFAVSRGTFLAGAVVAAAIGLVLAVSSLSRVVGAILVALAVALLFFGLAYGRTTARQRHVFLIASVTVLAVLVALGLLTIVYAHFLTADTSQ
jgi:uncharacterized membrane protein